LRWRDAYGGRSLGPGALSLDGTMPPATLVDIAALAAEEGCVGETLGVLVAERQPRRAVHNAIRRAVRETLATPIRSYDGIDVAGYSIGK
jgi:hypothetical protein